MTASGRTARRVHVVVLTAIPLEHEAVRKVEAGAWAGSTWEVEEGPHGLPVAFRTYQGRGGHRLKVALAQAPNMGAVEAMQTLLPLVETYRPSCIAMAGVCAGRRGKTRLGDVIAADRLFFHDTGKQLPDDVQQDLTTYNLRNDWKIHLERFGFAERFSKESWWLERPIPLEWQQNWLLSKLYEGVADPGKHLECDTFCSQWKEVVLALRKSGDLKEKGKPALTSKGRSRIEEVLLLGRDELPDLTPAGKELPFRVHVAPIGSGNKVIEDEEYWGYVSDSMRKTLGLEMEAGALGVLAHGWRSRRERGIEALVMKGVMDFGDNGRDDHFKEFAARASAECLLAFLREHLDLDVAAGFDDLLDPGTEPLPSPAAPSQLLTAKYEVVPFYRPGRAALIEELERWCDSEPVGVAARLVHGDGGAGKTRLAIELTRQRREQGWLTGFLKSPLHEDWFDRLCADGRPVLVAIDYAESHPKLKEVLMRALRYQQQQGSGPLRRVRLLLLARNDGEWFESLKESDEALGNWLDGTPPTKLAALAGEAPARAELFREAAQVFAKRRGRAMETPQPPPLEDALFGRVLYLHMAALASVDGLAFEANTLMDVTLKHEERFWVSLADPKRAEVVANEMGLARQIVAAATLRGGVRTREEALSLIDRLLLRPRSRDEEDLLRVLHRVYQRSEEAPSESGAEGALPEHHRGPYLPPLEPDLLGEGMVLRVANAKKGDEVGADWIERVFAAEDDATAVTVGLTVLGRASGTDGKAVVPWMRKLLAEPELKSRATLALEAAKAVGVRTALSGLGEVLADALEAHGSVTDAAALEKSGIPESTVMLLRVAEWTDRKLLAALPPSGDAEAQAERARRLNNLGNRLRETGRREEALAATREAVEQYRALAERNRDAFLPNLAASLNNLGASLRETGRREEALAATREAVEQYRALAERNRDAFLPYLAGSLNNLGAMLSETGSREEALAATREAVELRRALAERNRRTRSCPTSP